MQSIFQSFKRTLAGHEEDDYDLYSDNHLSPVKIAEHALHTSHTTASPSPEAEHMRHIVPASGSKPQKESADEWLEQEDPGGELAVDVYQTETHIVIRALIAGVPINNIDIALTREMVVIMGTREEEREVEEEDFFIRELYWGAFSRSILLSEEVDIDLAEATEKHGVLTIRLPKINKARQAKIKVKKA